jgi:putative tryptophan/tyrosine transport system substrate-binding protein
MRRRDFITLLSGAAAWPLAARAQQSTMPVVGFLSIASRRLDDRLRLAFFWEGLKEAGYVEGRNVASEYRGAEGRYDRLPELAADLLRRHPAVIVAVGGPIPALAAMVIGCLLNPDNPNTETHTREAQEAAHALGRKLELLQARDETEIETAFATLGRKGIGALVVVPDAFFNSRPEQFAALAARHMIPAIYSLHEFAKVGGLMSYGFNNADAFRLAGVHASRILNGAKPADLPVIQATKVELVINVKTAKTLGITFPLSLLGRADEVIE